MFRNNLELILGPVCSGKSAELLRRIDRYQIAGYNILLVKPKIDTRSKTVKSRNGAESKCVTLEKAESVFDVVVDNVLEENKQVSIVAFDEAQFFDDIYVVVKELLSRDFKVLVSGLDTDFHGEPFGDILKLVTLSDTVTKLTAVCMKCKGDNAIFSQKLRVGGNQVEIGDLELYQPRCNNCFVAGGIDEN
jgi:thymidine kinase